MNRIFIFCLFLVIASTTVFSQNDAEFYIETIDIQIQTKTFFGGNTKERHLLYALGIKEGQTFNSVDQLYQFVNSRDQQMKNLPSFKEGTGEVIYSLSGTTRADRAKGVIITIKGVEAFNMFALPGPKYDSNNGLELKLKLFHYNFLGTLRKLSINLEYLLDPNGYSGFGVDGDVSLPLYIKNKLWNLNLGLGGKYGGKTWNPNNSDDMAKNVFWTSVGIDTSWPLGQKYRIYTGFTEQINVTAGQFYGDKNEDAYYLSSRLYAGIPINVVEVPLLGWLRYNFSIGATTYYRFDKAVLDKRVGLFPDTGNGFSLGFMNRVGNFQQGIMLNADSFVSFDPSKARNYGLRGQYRTGLDQYPWQVNFSTSLKASFPYKNAFALKGRVGWEYAVFGDKPDRDLGGVVRGIRDNRMQGDMVVYWNTDLEMNVWIWRLSVLGEAHASIFYDGGITRNFRGKWNDAYHAVGIELILYPSFSRNVLLRASFGEDLSGVFYNRNLFGTSPRGIPGPQHELYLGLDLHY